MSIIFRILQIIPSLLICRRNYVFCIFASEIKIERKSSTLFNEIFILIGTRNILLEIFHEE